MTVVVPEGRACVMCDGSGEDADMIVGPGSNGWCDEVIGWVLNGKPCRACLGHGVEPT